MTKMYVPVAVEALPEYLSTGYLGLQSSSAYSQDLQTHLFPNIVAAKSPISEEGYCLLECSFSNEDIIGEGDKSTIIGGPAPISVIAKILFYSSEALAEFRSIYEPMNDLHLNYFDLDVLDVAAAQPLDTLVFGHKITKKPQLRLSPPNGAAIAYAIGDALPQLVYGNLAIQLRAKNRSELLSNLISEVLIATNMSSSKTGPAMYLLDLYLEALENEPVGTLRSAGLIAKLQSGCSERGAIGDESDALKAVSAVVSKLHKISMGLEDEFSFQDDPKLTLQRALCLTCLIDDYSALKAVRRNWTVGPQVEALAKILIASNSGIAQISGNVDSLDKEKLFAALRSGAEISRKSAIKLNLERTAMDLNFNSVVTVRMNDRDVSREPVSAPNDLMRVVTELKSCGYDPKPHVLGGIEVVHYGRSVSKGASVFINTLEGPTSKFKQNIDIYSSIPMLGAKSPMSNRKGRKAIFDIAERYLVSVRENHNQDLEVHRYQLIDTMDREEMNFHVELVALAADEITAQIVLEN